MEKGRMLGVSLAFLMVTASPSVTNAQSGNNDAAFNKPDKIAAQGANDLVLYSGIQPDNKLLFTGRFTKYNGIAATGIVRLGIDGKPDKTFNPTVTGNYGTFAIQPNSKILAAGSFPTAGGDPEILVRLNTNGSKDNSFHAALDSMSVVSQVIVQPNEKILLLGAYYAPGQPSRQRVVRLNKNGSVDYTFSPNITDSLLGYRRIALQADGKVLVAGSVISDWDMRNFFTVVRLNANGSRDFSFNLSSVGLSDSYLHINDMKVETDGGVLVAVAFDNHSSLANNGIIARFNSHGDFLERVPLFWINALAIQPDGKIVCAGTKNLGPDIGKTEVRRLNSDLTVDASFVFDPGKTYSTVYASELKTLSLQVDGKLVIAGDFTEVNGIIGNNITRLNANGNVDLTFNQRKGSDGSIFASAVLPNGKTIIGGQFERYNYFSSHNLARLKSNGDLDPAFNVGSGTNGKVNAIAIQANGKVLIGGNFTAYNGHACNNIARLNTDGSLDASFIAGADAAVRKIKIDSDGKIVIAGDFKNVNGTSKVAVARLEANGTLDPLFNTSIALPQFGGAYDFVFADSGKLYVAVNYIDSLDHYSYDAKLIRLNMNGSTDDPFHFTDESFYEIHSLTLNNAGKPIIGGEAIYPRDHRPGKISQYNTDGSLDTSFNGGPLTNTLEGSIRTINVLSNDKIIIGGDFANHIELLNADVTIDGSFTASASNTIYTTAVTGADQLIIAGTFSEYSGVVRNSIARIDVSIPDATRTTQGVGNLSQDAQEAQWYIYPNPAVSDLHVQNLNPGSVLKIVNAIGMEMHSEVVSNGNATINLANYSNGIYFVFVADNDHISATKKLIVNK